jgi:hypothetical protein
LASISAAQLCCVRSAILVDILIAKLKQIGKPLACARVDDRGRDKGRRKPIRWRGAATPAIIALIASRSASRLS